MTDLPSGAPPGFATGIVRLFIESRLAVLLLIASLLAGVFALFVTPREEDPQIVVPVVDLLVEMPGASVAEVERLAATSLEAILKGIHGVENVYSVSYPGWCLVTARFYVGEDREQSLTKVFTMIEANKDRVPPGVSGWRIFPVDIDDVPIVTAVLISSSEDHYSLRKIGQAVLADLRGLPEIGRTEVVGGSRREMRFILDPARLAAHGLSPLEVLQAITMTNRAVPAGEISSGNREVAVRTGPLIASVHDLERVVVGVSRNADGPRPVTAAQVSAIIDGPEEPVNYTRFGFGPGEAIDGGLPSGLDAALEYPSVTLAIAKRKGSNAVTVAEAVKARLHALRGTLIPENVEVRITRDYGASADQKVNDLVVSLATAILIVVSILGIGLGWREAGVVALVVPMTFAVTLFANLVFGYTLNRVTLFSIILSLGLIVDDPIVMVENIYRHFRLRRHPPLMATLAAIDEIEKPTLWTSLTVIFAFLPMFFITGMMGPYMAPMAFNVPAAMVFSLIAVFTVTPWAAYHALRREYDAPVKSFDIRASSLFRVYGAILRPLMARRSLALLFLGAIGLLFLLSVAMVPLGLVPMKMLPFANKDDLLLSVDMPEGTPLEATNAVLTELGDLARRVPEVKNYEVYAGLASPIDFNGLVRQYFLRRGGNVGDLRLNLVARRLRQASSHEIALRLRAAIDRIAARHGAVIRIVETPPGPPVLSTLVAEVFGPENAPYAELRAVAKRVREKLATVENAVEVDWTMEDERERLDVVIDQEKAALAGISVKEAAMTARIALAGGEAGGIREGFELEPIPIWLRLPKNRRVDDADLRSLRVRGQTGALVPLGEIARIKRVPEDLPIYHKDLRPVVYVTADVAGVSPVNVLFRAQKALAGMVPEGYQINWRGEGEWKITVDVFRDLGIAFGAASVMIYIILSAQTGSLVVPLIMMLAIPCTMIGVFPGFWLLNLFASPVEGLANPIFFTATGMIGLITLAGIVVRNSIMLIDFIEVLRRQGRSLEEAVVEAGVTRLRPIILTAGTSMFGAMVIVLDPVFSGMAWSFVFGIFASTVFTLFVVPAAYYLVVSSYPDKGDRSE